MVGIQLAGIARTGDSELGQALTKVLNGPSAVAEHRVRAALGPKI